MDEDSDKVPSLDGGGGERMRTFSPSRRSNTTGYQHQSFSRPSTATGLQRTPSFEPLIRRKTSRQFSRTSVDTDSILLDRPAAARKNNQDEDAEDTKEHWHSISLIFVALPAFAGMFFENGSAVMTDILMLGLGCLFLYWSVKWPWQWYYSTQEMKLADIDASAEFAIDEESDDDTTQKPLRNGKSPDGGGDDQNLETAWEGAKASAKKNKARSDLKRSEALQALQSLEIMALTSCFLAPGAVAYMLHSIRPYLSRPSGGVVSNSNLTLFVLAAELRPVLHFFRLVEERTLHLQRVVTSLPLSDEKLLEERVEALTKRIEEFETSPSITTQQPPSTVNGTPAVGSTDIEHTLRQSLQPQLDALNRAVRRYEKRATTQAIVTEARLQDLEARLRDALSLAAAASRNSQKPGVFGQMSEVLSWVLTKPLEALRQSLLMPFLLAGEAWRFLFGPRRRKKKGSGGTSSTSTGAAQSKFAGEFKGKQRVEAR